MTTQKSKVAKNITELIGNTPLLELQHDGNAKILLKLEFMNPLSSVKDRIAHNMIQMAEEEGHLKPGGTIIEPTSGNTGIGLAFVGASKGYKVIMVMPESMSMERRILLRALGAELHLTPAKQGMKGAIKRAEELAAQTSNSFMPLQFSNKYNPQIHEKTTGPEIWNDTEGEISVLISGVGTGGTITGAGKYLKEKNKNIEIVAVEPLESSVIQGNAPSPHKIQGIGAGFIPEILNREIIDRIESVSSEDAMNEARYIVKNHGIPVGISSGATINVAKRLSQEEKYKNKTIVVIVASSIERYLSSPILADIADEVKNLPIEEVLL